MEDSRIEWMITDWNGRGQNEMEDNRIAWKIKELTGR